MTIVVPFKEGTVPGLQPQGGFLGEQEGLCTLQEQPRTNTAVTLLQVVEYLLEQKADVYVRNNKGETALDLAAQFGHVEVVREGEV